MIHHRDTGEDALSAPLPPVPDLPAPPLPPRPDVPMAPPAARENPEHPHGSKEKEREPRPERGPSTPPPAPVQAPTVTTTSYEETPLNKGTVYTPTCPSAGTATNADRHHFPYSGTPTNKRTDTAPTLGRYYQKPLERAHATDPLGDQILADGSSTSWLTSVRADTDLQGDGGMSLAPAQIGGNIPLRHPDASVRPAWEQRRKITGERNDTATTRGRHPTGTITTASGCRLTCACAATTAATARGPTIATTTATASGHHPTGMKTIGTAATTDSGATDTTCGREESGMH